MANGDDWYPRKLSGRIPFHANLASQAALTGVADGLTQNEGSEAEEL